MEMIYRRLGGSGLKVSALSFGSWVTFARQLDVKAATALMSQAYDAGINFFDNAEGYEKGQSEVVMGKVLAASSWRRDSYLVSSKVFWGKDPDNPRPTQEGLSRKHVFDACHAALKRLQVDYLDLYFCHRPDPETPIIETVRAMTDLVRQGKVMYWGTSEWSAAEIIEAHEEAQRWQLVPLTMEQPCYNMASRRRFEIEYKPLFERYGMGTTIWSPLASGILTGKYLDGIKEGSRLSLEGYEWLSDAGKPDSRENSVAKVVVETAKKLDLTPARLALAWCLRNPNVSTVILGATKSEQLAENLLAVEDVEKITDEVAAEIEKKIGPPV